MKNEEFHEKSSDRVFSYSFENYNNDNEINKEDYNDLPFTQALRLDKRNIMITFYSIFKMKIELIAIIFYPDEYIPRTFELSIYFLNFLFSYFMNALLYSDDIISQKYHNNGQLELITSIFLSLTSNIISSIIVWAIKGITSYDEILRYITQEIKHDYLFQTNFIKYFKLVKLKAFIYYIISFILSISIIYYLYLFCEIYNKSQISLLINYLLGIIESLIFSLSISIIICILRICSIKYKLKAIYRTSVYLNQKF